MITLTKKLPRCHSLLCSKVNNCMQNTSQKLYDLLSSKDYTVKTLDSAGKEATDMDEVVMFSFDFEVAEKNFGTVVVLLNSEEDMEVFFGDAVGKTMDREEKKVWTDLMYQLRMFAKRNLMGFKLENIQRLKYSMQSMAAMNESFQSIFESYYGTSKTSYSPQGKAKIIIKHSKPIGEGDKRYRNVSSVFIQNESGERFKLPFTRLPGARAMARHVTEGGNPYDMFGQHITEMVKDIGTLSGFVRRSKMFAEDEATVGLVETGRTHYDSMRKGLKQIAGKRGYHTYKESWTPSDITETEQDVNNIRQLFTREAINQKVDNAIPLLARLSANQPDLVLDEIIPKREESEVSEFEQWADSIVDGSESLVEEGNNIEIEELNDWFQTEQSFGINGLNVTNALYDIIDDRKLMAEIEKAAEADPEADSRSLVYNWLSQKNPEILDQIHYDPANKVTEDNDLDSNHQCDNHDDDDKITNKGNGMSTFKDYTEVEEDKQEATKQVPVTESTQQPTYDEFESLIKRTNYLLQK